MVLDDDFSVKAPSLTETPPKEDDEHSSQDYVNIIDIQKPIECLIIFASIGNLSAVRYCIQTARTDPNEFGPGNRLALNEAIGNGHPKIVQYLIAHGADIHQEGAYNEKLTLLNAIEAAQECRIEKIQELVINKLTSEINSGIPNHNRPVDRLIYYVRKGNLIEVKHCVEKLGINPSEYGTLQRLTLNEAIYKKNFEITKYLIEHGADIHKEGLYSTKKIHYDAFDASYRFSTSEIHQLLVQKLSEQADAEATEKDKPTSQVDGLSREFFIKPFTYEHNER